MKTGKPIGARGISARSRRFQRELTTLVKGLRRDIASAHDASFQALLETSAEVLKGIRTDFAHVNAGRETAWNGK